MKKLVLFSSIITALSFASIEGQKYIDNNYNFTIAARSSWTITEKNSRKRVAIESSDGSSSVDVDVWNLSTQQKTAEDVALFQVEAYDGWQYHGSRPAEPEELARARASEGFVAIYTKKLLSSDRSVKTIIVTERYFVKDRKAFIISGITDDRNWSAVKNDLLDTMDSFTLL